MSKSENYENSVAKSVKLFQLNKELGLSQEDLDVAERSVLNVITSALFQMPTVDITLEAARDCVFQKFYAINVKRVL